mgnify:CR=1 FL=1
MFVTYRRAPLLIAVVMQMSQQLSGINAVSCLYSELSSPYDTVKVEILVSKDVCLIQQFAVDR